MKDKISREILNIVQIFAEIAIIWKLKNMYRKNILELKQNL